MAISARRLLLPLLCLLATGIAAAAPAAADAAAAASPDEVRLVLVSIEEKESFFSI